jgi:hypothetical protein
MQLPIVRGHQSRVLAHLPPQLDGGVDNVDTLGYKEVGILELQLHQDVLR